MIVKITPQQLTQFLVTYYTGGHPYQKLGQAFVNQNTGIDSVLKLAALHKERSDKKAMEIITRDYVRDEV